jgi:hypothetical protein
MPLADPLPTHDRLLASVLAIEQPTRWAAVQSPSLLAFALVMLVWGVAGEGLWAITGVLDEVCR